MCLIQRGEGGYLKGGVCLIESAGCVEFKGRVCFFFQAAPWYDMYVSLSCICVHVLISLCVCTRADFSVSIHFLHILMHIYLEDEQDGGI